MLLASLLYLTYRDNTVKLKLLCCEDYSLPYQGLDFQVVYSNDLEVYLSTKRINFQSAIK